MAPTTAAVFSQDELGGAYFATAAADAQVMLWKANFNLKENDDSIEAPAATVKKSSRSVLQSRSQDNFASSTIKANVDTRQKPEQEALDVGEAFLLPGAAKKAGQQEAFYPKYAPGQAAPQKGGENVTTVNIAPLTTTIPEMTTALTQIVHQLDILTQTMSIIEDRLSAVEDKAFQVKQQAQQQGQAGEASASQQS